MSDASGLPQPQAPARRGMPGWLIALITLPVIALVVLPVFAALAIYGVRKYVLNAKTAEARNSLGEIARQAAATYDPQRGFCPSAPHPVPSSESLVSGQKYQSVPADWADSRAPDTGFACLKFSLETPQYYQYSYKSIGPRRNAFEATARGDLNGDGTFSTFTVRGTVGPGGVVAIAPKIEEVLPEE